MFLRRHFSSWQKSSSVLRLPFLFVFTQPSQWSSEGCVRRASEGCGASLTRSPYVGGRVPRGTPLRLRASLLFLRGSTLLLPDLRRDSARPQLGPSAAQAEAPTAGDTAALGPPPPTSSMLPASLLPLVPTWGLEALLRTGGILSLKELPVIILSGGLSSLAEPRRRSPRNPGDGTGDLRRVKFRLFLLDRGLQGVPGGPPAPILHSLHLMQTTPKINTGGGWDGRAERDAQ
ncbi:unnamed protein product [Boreogadus saida]